LHDLLKYDELCDDAIGRVGKRFSVLLRIFQMPEDVAERARGVGGAQI
jgi:hypothetical protein